MAKRTASKDEIPKKQRRASKSTISKLRCLFVLVMLMLTSIWVFTTLLPEDVKVESTRNLRITSPNVVPHSYMVDILTADDENTRASVTSLEGEI